VSVRLSTDTAWRVIDAAHTGIFTTMRADGTPVALPVWFVTVDKTICIGAPSQTKKVARVRNNPRASFLVESGQRWAELQAVHISGNVEIVEDEEVMSRISDALDDKYAAFMTAPKDLPPETRERYEGRTFLRLIPDGRLLSWDNSNIKW
jgi:PPOX class probable F420-dependent enzyme